MTTRVADQRVLVGTTATLSWTSLTADGEPAAADGTVTVKVDKADGTAVLTVGATSGTNPYTRSLPAASNLTLESLTATWYVDGVATATTYIEVVGAYYFSIAAARDRDASLNDAGGYTLAVLTEARRQVEDYCERYTNAAWVPRWRQARLSGTGSTAIVLPDPKLRTVRAARIYTSATAYTSLTADELAAIPADDAGIATRTDGGTWPTGDANIVIEYEHGHDRPPADLVNAAIVHLRLQINETRTGFSAEPQIITDAIGNVIDVPSPWRTVLGTYKRYRVQTPGFA